MVTIVEGIDDTAIDINKLAKIAHLYALSNQPRTRRPRSAHCVQCSRRTATRTNTRVRVSEQPVVARSSPTP